MVKGSVPGPASCAAGAMLAGDTFAVHAGDPPLKLTLTATGPADRSTSAGEAETVTVDAVDARVVETVVLTLLLLCTTAPVKLNFCVPVAELLSQHSQP